MCLDAASPQGPVKIVRCHGMGGNQAWVYNDEVRKRKDIEKKIYRKKIYIYRYKDEILKRSFS